jgi:hypothetical protein
MTLKEATVARFVWLPTANLREETDGQFSCEDLH